MIMDKKKVLIITESLSYGGNNIVAMNLEKHLNKDLFECTYCVRRDSIGAFEQDAIDRGIRVIHVPDSELSYYKSYKFYKGLFKNEQFDIVHCHLPFISGLIFMAAKKSGVNKRIAHAHFSQPYTDTAIYSRKKQAVAKAYRVVMRILLRLFCNCMLACGTEAGSFLYGAKTFKKYGTVLNNGIDTSAYLFDSFSRNKVRKEFGIDNNAVVIGHIGQMYSVKNQSFLIDVFSKFKKNISNSFLLLVGDGTDKEMLENKVKELNLSDSVIFTGNRSDANDLYMAMDVFVFPSLHEGYPMTLIEAQASKLSCLVSSNVTKAVKINDNVEFLSIEEKPSVWADRISWLIHIDRITVNNERLINLFDIKNVVLQLEKIYLS